VPRGHWRHPATGRRLRPNQAGGIPQGLKTSQKNRHLENISQKICFCEENLLKILEKSEKELNDRKMH
jgi:hypothetical protein